MEEGAYNARYDAHVSVNPFASTEYNDVYDCMDERAEKNCTEGASQHYAPFRIHVEGEEMSKNMYLGACKKVANLSSSLLQQGNAFLQENNLIGEGPKTLRAFCFLGGLMLVVSSLFSVLNVFSFLTGPCTYILQIYLTALGLITMIVEAKDMSYLERYKSFMYEWFKFLTVPAGKGAFYFFNGLLAVSLLSFNILSLVSGLYMAVFGIICILIHMGMRNRITQVGIEIEENHTNART